MRVPPTTYDDLPPAARAAHDGHTAVARITNMKRTLLHSVPVVVTAMRSPVEGPDSPPPHPARSTTVVAKRTRKCGRRRGMRSPMAGKRVWYPAPAKVSWEGMRLEFLPAAYRQMGVLESSTLTPPPRPGHG